MNHETQAGENDAYFGRHRRGAGPICARHTEGAGWNFHLCVTTWSVGVLSEAGRVFAAV